jgi:hypothetical protein
MGKLFITGMGRSGTTLLDKLLTNHDDIDVLSQPLPLLYVEAKNRFLKDLGVEKYFVLNDDLISKNYTQKEFDAYLSHLILKPTQIADIFKKMEGYSGQSTKADFPIKSDLPPAQGLSGLIDLCLSSFSKKLACRYIGTKEIMCEEFLPYLCVKGYKCILILRDPRDVLASVNYPKKEKYLGEKKPTLFILRSWRKSVEYAFQLRNKNNFHMLRYEDLVADPMKELGAITEFLGVPGFPPDQFEKGILDRDGVIWGANSSFGINGSFISKRPDEMYKSTLTAEEIAYTEAVCSLELGWLGYPFQYPLDMTDTIRGFRDHGVPGDQNISADFSSQEINADMEIERLSTFRNFFGQ